MKLNLLILLMSFMMLNACSEAPQNTVTTYDSYDDYPVYEGDGLGLTYQAEKSEFRLWAPTATSVKLNFYSEPLGGKATEIVDMRRAEKGTWTAIVEKGLQGAYYTFQVEIDGNWSAEVPDPYAKAVGTNGQRAQVIDLSQTNPEGWAETERPAFVQPTDAVIYELHVRDLSIAPNSGIKNKGKYLGLAEENTQTESGITTGLSHIAGLGVTHVHLLPVFDFRTVDESRLHEPQFNWGYDPQNYNVPEGSYATDPANGATRIREFKTAIQALHANGLRVIMDVVYNHTGVTENSLFNELVPGYYYRQKADGSFSDASACGNETASERAMMRKFIVESVVYWATEYQIDGFRFDLMGIHDIQTMEAVRAALDQVDPSILVYGEGWTAGDSPIPAEDRALKANTYRMKGIAAFSDDIRDGLKGSVFEHDQKAFVSGAEGRKEDVKFGIAASVDHPQVNYHEVAYSDGPWAKDPVQTVTYVSCHDNHTLWDRLAISCPDVSEEERIKMHKLALATVLTSQGIPFLHAGSEMLRTKNGEENSYKSPDAINQIDWERKGKYQSVYEYVKGLIALRKAHPAFRMTRQEQLQKHLKFVDVPEENFIVYSLNDHANGDSWKDILVLLNGSPEEASYTLPEGSWKVVVDGASVYPEGAADLNGPTVKVPARVAMVLYKNE